ncbi:diguanylate cyclase/phosphodiesterase (GGDEF & EAL domains) with PAS/PAC sensor(s) [hydrothermal vent metagenome]|uniref:Diguanylate cyclase/phosphodiesterase (GGDEF & EAL domains) with PAS/PAC sensor(S) n=1 Tax=hydrothermal vent metagenome TaxID=652676 RepID=A0A3B1B4U8_9ZZZZ
MLDSPNSHVTLRLLLVEDNPDDAELVLRVLRKGGYNNDSLRVDNEHDLREALENSNWDIVLSDYSMPGFSGLAALNILKELNLDIPFIIISGTIGEEVAVEAMRLGAHDYLMKNNLIRLVPAIQRELHDANERYARRIAEQTLRHQAYHDVLTGLPNRWLLRDRMEQALAYVRKKDLHLGVLFLDLDRFKNLNDTLGHLVGDHLLRAVADRLKKVLSAWDTVARLGGDDFVLLLPDIKEVSALEEKAQELLTLFDTPFELSGKSIYLDVSIGIAAYPENGEDSDSLLKNAEATMYYAKEQGGKNYQFCSGDIQTATVDRFTIESELRVAIKNSELLLHYQPQFSLEDNSITGVEVLVRWEHPERGMTPPDKFIPVAEDTGLIIPLGEWVLQQTIADIVRMREAGIRLKRVAVNLSARQLYHQGTQDTLRKLLAAGNLGAELLEVEITESGIMQNPELAAENLISMKSIGVGVAIDDFGTGYSSLAHLKRFPIDVLKIDRAFVRDITLDSDDASIVKAILALAKALNLHVIAEGLETQEQYDYLKELGCNEGQGYLYARPMPIDDLLIFIQEKQAN